MRRRLLLLVPTALLVGCQRGPASTPTVTVTTTVTATGPVPHTQSPVPSPDSPAQSTPAPRVSSVTLAVGGTIDISVGATNESRGMSWSLAEPGDPAVAEATVTVGKADPNCKPGGCDKPVTLHLTGRSKGRSRVRVNLHNRISQRKFYPPDLVVDVVVR